MYYSYKIRLLLFPLFLILTIFSKGQKLNNSAVIDSVFLRADRHKVNQEIPRMQIFPFQPYFTTASITRGSEAVNSLCKDSSVRRRFREDSLHISAYSITNTSDGNILLPGSRQLSFTPYRHIGYLLKCTPQGDTIWVKNFASTQTNSIFYFDAYELNDQGILLVGKINVPVPVNSRYDLVLTKLTANGDFLWQRTFVSALMYQGSDVSELEIYDLKSTASGDIFFCGGLIVGGFSRFGLAGRLSSDGSVIWNKSISMQGFTEFVGFNLLGNELQAYGDAATNDNVLVMVSFNILTGDTIVTKKWDIPPGPNSYWRKFRPFQVTKLNNGNTILAGRCVTDLYSPDPNFIAHVGALELSPTFNFVDAWRIGNNRLGSYYFTRIKVSPDGSAGFVTVNGDATTGYLNYGKMKNGLVVKERAINAYSLFIGEPLNFLHLANGGDFMAANLTVVPGTTEINTFRMNDTDTSGGCMGNDLPLSIIEHQQYIPVNIFVDSIKTNIMQEIFIHANYLPFNDGFNITDVCKQVYFCDSLKLTPSVTTLCLPSILNVDVYTNHACGGTLDWLYNSSSISQPVYINDTTAQITFSANFTGYITAGIRGCSGLLDSFYIKATMPQQAVNLGSDQIICPNNSIILNAHNGYSSYLWQDGTVDSVLTVSQPGIYYVTVMDECANVFSDTVIVSAPPLDSFNAGPDRVKCNFDTLQLTAMPGFLNYTWSNNYNINTLVGQTVIVNPSMDTAYYVKAENSSGCFFYDTVYIFVHHSPSIDLGPDIQICRGDSALFHAGAGFQSYQWSNGFNTEQISVGIPGQYTVVATTAEGCKSLDTVKILSFFPKPVVLLNKDTAFCMNSEKTLFAGNFNSYFWNTGDTTASISINTPGTYTVTVIDVNGCMAMDSTVLKSLYAPPIEFLPGDTFICKYDKLELNPISSSFNYVLWSTGSSSPSITITQPGIYWLEVKNNYGCLGRDSIIVNSKDCLFGFYIPNAFTPNNDNKNDFFRPLLFGQVVDYQFLIYDRWGQLVFHSNNPQVGWDGSRNGIPESTSTLIWICKYRFAGEAMQTRRGSFLIIR